MDLSLFVAFCIGFLAGIVFIAITCIVAAYDDPRDRYYDDLNSSFTDEMKGEKNDDQN